MPTEVAKSSQSIFIVVEDAWTNRYLLVHNRPEEKIGGHTKPAGWGLPGGGAKDEENDGTRAGLIKAIRRELYEETGLLREDVELVWEKVRLPYFEAKPDWEKDGGLHQNLVIYGRLKGGFHRLSPMPGSDVDEAKWFSWKEVRQLHRAQGTRRLYESHYHRLEAVLDIIDEADERKRPKRKWARQGSVQARIQSINLDRFWEFVNEVETRGRKRR